MLNVAGTTVHALDHGLIIRGPHPRFPGRLVTIMAGPHSLGTGAACLAATNSALIAQIQAKLPEDVRLGDKQRTIYALVEGRADETDGHLYSDGVTILEAGTLDK